MFDFIATQRIVTVEPIYEIDELLAANITTWNSWRTSTIPALR